MSAQSTNVSPPSIRREPSGFSVASFRAASPWFIGLLAVSIFAFWRPYFSQLFAIRDAATHFHVATMLVWCGLLIVQPWLIRTRRHAVHRRLGQFSYGLFLPMLAGFVLLAHERLNALQGPPEALRHYILYLQVMGLLLFASCYLMAIVWRRSPLVHARFMVGTGLVLIDPVVARIVLFWIDATPAFPPQFLSYPIIDAFLVALIVLERKAGSGRAVFPALLGLFAVFQVLTFVVTAQPFWADFARWFAGF